MLAAVLSRAPFVVAAEVDQELRDATHTASLPCPQFDAGVRHDTPVNGLGNKAGTENV